MWQGILCESTLSDLGGNSRVMTFQIDTGMTCNTIAQGALTDNIPNMWLNHSPYLLYPYRDTTPLKPVGQSASERASMKHLSKSYQMP